MRIPGAQHDTNEDGATAVEYALLVALIAGILIAVMSMLGSSVIPLYDVTF